MASSIQIENIFTIVFNVVGFFIYLKNVSRFKNVNRRWMGLIKNFLHRSSVKTF